MASVRYLTMNSVQFGVGSSQVWEYVKRLPALGHEISVLSFEPGRVDSWTDRDVPEGVTWSPHEFGKGGPLAAARRVLACRDAARRARDEIVHARSDLPALGTILAGHDRWIWDMRAFWREQRLALGAIRAESATERALRELERQAARRSSAIICLAEAAVPVLAARFGPAVADKVTVIPTVVDTARFVPGVGARSGPIRVMLSGTYNAFYDGAAMAGFIAALRRRTRIEAGWVGSSAGSPWADVLEREVDHHVASAPFADMPSYLAGSDLGLVVCRADGGTALKGAVPTKIAEFLACGRPVVVNRGLGDMDALLAKYRCGVALSDGSAVSQERAADEVLELMADPQLAERCRTCAVDRFDLDAGVQRLASLYGRLA